MDEITAETFIDCFLSTKHYTEHSSTPLSYETFTIIPFDESESRFKWVNAFPNTTKLMNGGWVALSFSWYDRLDKNI